MDGETLARNTYRDCLDIGDGYAPHDGKARGQDRRRGTSMGGTIAVWLAARYPDLVDGVILCSPFFDVVDPAGRVLEYPGGLLLGELLMGKISMAMAGPKHVEGGRATGSRSGISCLTRPYST